MAKQTAEAQAAQKSQGDTMTRPLASALSIAATLLELAAALAWLARDVLVWKLPPSDPLGEWADSDGAAALRALAMDGDGMVK